MTIGELAHQAGISTQTLRHYHSLGILRPTAMSSAGYRLYSEYDRTRLELIRALRGVDVDLPMIARLLKGAVSVREVAELHLRTLDHQARAIARRRAILRVLVRAPAAPTSDRITRLHALAGFERLERERFVADQLRGRMRHGGKSALERFIVSAGSTDLPELPTEDQVEAWLELAELISDPGFLARHRTGPATDTTSPSTGSMRAWQRETALLYKPAARAARSGTDPRGREARVIVRQWARAIAARTGQKVRSRNAAEERLGAVKLLAKMDTHKNANESRFWELLGVLKPEIAESPITVARPWLVAALRAWVE